jgi:hypothetical protein
MPVDHLSVISFRGDFFCARFHFCSFLAFAELGWRFNQYRACLHFLQLLTLPLKELRICDIIFRYCSLVCNLQQTHKLSFWRAVGISSSCLSRLKSSEQHLLFHVVPRHVVEVGDGVNFRYNLTQSVKCWKLYENVLDIAVRNLNTLRWLKSTLRASSPHVGLFSRVFRDLGLIEEQSMLDL